MTITLPQFVSALTQPVSANNFVAVQSVKLPVTTTSTPVTFTAIPGTLRVTMKITNSGATGCYISSGASSVATPVAVASTTSPQPAAGTPIVSNCDYVAAGSILTQDYIQGTDTIAAICGTGSTTLEISIGYGQ